MLDCKSIYIVLLFCWKPPTARSLKWLLYLEVTWHLTIKLFPAKIIAKSTTTEGNSALLPAIRKLKQKRRRRLRKRHLKRWIRSTSNFAAPIPLSIRTIVVIFFWRWILKDYFEVQVGKEKESRCLRSHPRQNVKFILCTTRTSSAISVSIKLNSGNDDNLSFRKSISLFSSKNGISYALIRLYYCIRVNGATIQ